MPQLVKEVIQYRELQSDIFSRLVWELDNPVIYQYAVGNPKIFLVPIDAELIVPNFRVILGNIKEY